MVGIQLLVRQFFTTLGVDLTPPKVLFFNDREGTLLVHASLADLDIIEAGVQALNIAPPEINIKSKFVEVTQDDNRALGFDWYLGNFLMNNGSIGLQGGTAPSFNAPGSPANPSGTFPGNAAAGTTIAPATTDQLITGGLRNQYGQIRELNNIPALGTLTGILTDPQFRMVIKAIEQRQGVDLLNEASVTTESGRQTQINVSDLITIVTGTSANTQTGAGGLGTTGVGGVGVASTAAGLTINYPTAVLPFGTTLDVVPYVSADGYTIQMTLIPTLTEFLGYDPPGPFVPLAAITGLATTPTGTLPLPHFRLRQVTTSAIVWDGQTVVLGGLISDNVTKLKDKVPVLGDLPFVGRFFTSESSSASKRNLMIFVTPRIIDPAGNPLHSEDEMPFAQSAIPAQKPVVTP
jgi:general secretion pathway protein D